jgi:hypothetical protein
VFSEGDNQDAEHLMASPVEGLVTQAIEEARGLAKKLSELRSHAVGDVAVPREITQRIQFSLYSLATMIEVATGREPTMLDYPRPTTNSKKELYEP